MFFEYSNGLFGCIHMVVMGWDEMNVHLVLFDVSFDCFGAFIAHHVEGWMVFACCQSCKDVDKCIDHCGFVF